MNMKQWHVQTVEETFQAVQSSPGGLTDDQAGKRLQEHGPNELEQGESKTLLDIFLEQFADLMIWVLIGAAVISGIVGEWIDAGIILIVVILNAVLGTVQESKAERALEALKAMTTPTANVIRNGNVSQIPARQLVVGDIVLLEAGDSIPADLRLIEAAALKAEESALTGESVPVDKTPPALSDPKLGIGDRTNMLYMGTNVTYGRGTGVVIATGMDTQMGAIAAQLASTEKEITPLQRKLNQISNILSIGVIGIAIAIFIVGLVSGREPLDMFLTAISLAVAAIPEGLVAVITIVLASGMTRMAARGAIIRRLPAVETLGSTQVICSDKTGTLTQNKMTVQQVWAENEQILCEAMGHCNDSKLDQDGELIGDPTETALIDYLLTEQLWTADQIQRRVRAWEIPFDSKRKLSTVAIEHPDGDGVRVYVKGAPDVLLDRCISEVQDGTVIPLAESRKTEISAANETMGAKALRVLAFAYKDTNEQPDLTQPELVEHDLTFVGLVGMIDPPRPEVKDAIATCRQAGIMPVMVTGDHLVTAKAIANELGIMVDQNRAITGAELEQMSDAELEGQVKEIAVYARVAPEHKSRIVRAWQRKGAVVAMTGDGVNDAPALKAADIGVGMGITGTDVSKQVADMVLTDDNFATIVSAVKGGRRIFDNIHKTVRFLLSSNVGEVLAILTATIIGWRMLAPVHILWINLVTDTFPALALGVEPAEPDVMHRPPRNSQAPLLSGKDWLRIAFVGTVEALAALFAYRLGGGSTAGTTMAFLTLSLSQLFAAIGFQSERHSIINIDPKNHPMLWLAFIASALLQLVVILVPFLRNLFDLAVLTGTQWLMVLGLCLIVLCFIEIQKWITK
ncbi:MAG: calcium-translocating P-type ATPase, PMCA-type [Bacillota bacterium]|nr:calcium-translocating P-type ATPase, PMCA-type [Bacillota bacterium]